MNKLTMMIYLIIPLDVTRNMMKTFTQSLFNLRLKLNQQINCKSLKINILWKIRLAIP